MNQVGKNKPPSVVVNKTIALLENQLTEIRVEGTSSHWVGVKDRRAYEFWMDGKKMRSRRLYGDVGEAMAAYERYRSCQFLENAIADMRAKL